MKAINDFLLGLFTRKNDIHPGMMFPSLENGIVYAHDAHVIISIPEDELSLKYIKQEKYPNAYEIISDIEKSSQSSIKVSVEQLAKELAKCRIETDKTTIECKDCGGSGMVEWEYEDKSRTTHYTDLECPVCDGDGYNEISSPFPRISILQQKDEDGNRLKIKIGEIYFHPFQLYRLFMVAAMKGYSEIKISYDKDNYGKTISCFGNIKVVVMAMSKN